MPDPTQINLSDRKAFALLSAYFGALGPTQAAQSDELKSVYRVVNDIAEELARDFGGTPLDEAVRDGAQRAAASVRSRYGGRASTDVEALLDAFLARAAGHNCVVCAKGPACRGVASDDALVAAGGTCVGEIREAFDSGLRRAGEAYRVAGGPPPVEVALHTRGLTDRPGLVPGGLLAANGATRFADTGAEKHSIVRIDVTALQIDRWTVAALPYVALHETFCHAFQMSRAQGPRPNKGRVVDPLSEGMMDALAVELLEAEADGLRLQPDIGPRAQAVADVARETHISRSSLVREPRFPEALPVARGVETLRLLRAMLAALGRPDAHAVSVRLACDMNLHPWSFAERTQGFARLVRGLNSLPRDACLLDLLLAYAEGGDVEPLIAYITKM